MCAGATALWVVSYPDTLLHELAYKTMLFTGISTIFFNINPLVKIDGYHALTSLLEMPRAARGVLPLHRPRSSRSTSCASTSRFPSLTRRSAGSTGPTVRSPSRTWARHVVHRGDLRITSTARSSRTWPWCSSSVSLAFIFKKRVRLVLRTSRLAYLDKKEYFMSRAARPRLAALAPPLLLLLFVPFSRETLMTDGVLGPADGCARGARGRPGRAVLAHESDAVRAGDVILRCREPGRDGRRGTVHGGLGALAGAARPPGRKARRVTPIGANEGRVGRGRPRERPGPS